MNSRASDKLYIYKLMHGSTVGLSFISTLYYIRNFTTLIYPMQVRRAY